MAYPHKGEMFNAGVAQVKAFCTKQGVEPPAIKAWLSATWRFDVCAYYREGGIHICVPKCAHVGTGGMSWSYPGYVIDRTPSGVLAHELGHFFDMRMGGVADRDRYRSGYSTGIRILSGEPKLTNYCPDDGEWFAEMFRLFVTNPDLLCKVRPRTYQLLCEDFMPGKIDLWDSVLAGAPERTVAQARKKITAAGSR